MKWIAYILGVICAVVGVAALCLLTVLATPNLFKNTENVIFIKDPMRDSESNKTTGELQGDGSGRNADNPLIPRIHEDYDPNAENPKNYLNTALYQATEKLKDSGGTVVIMGECYFGNGDVLTANFGENSIKFTSVYNNIDYRKNLGAKIILDKNANISVLGSSVWENITFETMSKDRVISFNCYATEIGNGVECKPSDKTKRDDCSYYLSLSAGSRTADSSGVNPFLLVSSGTYNKITAGPWGDSKEQTMENANACLFLGGNVRVLGLVSGTAQGKCDFGGNVNITISGGRYECDIIGVFGTGMTNTDGVVKIKINGGDFSKVWSICDCGIGIKNNPPMYSVLDFSNWEGKLSELANAYLAVNFFNEVILPDGISKDELKNYSEQTTKDTAVSDTQSEKMTEKMTEEMTEETTEDITVTDIQTEEMTYDSIVPDIQTVDTIIQSEDFEFQTQENNFDNEDEDTICTEKVLVCVGLIAVIAISVVCLLYKKQKNID